MKQVLTIILTTLFISIKAQDTTNNFEQLLDTVHIKTFNNQSSVRFLPKTVRVIKFTELQKMPVESLDDVLNLVAGIDIRTRGSKGVQSDISIRGGNFDQVLILLNGIKVNNPQTGHHGLDLPVDVSMIDRIEILEGASGQSFGINAYSGAINIITKKPDKEQANSSLKIGQYGYLKTDFDLAHSFNKILVYNGFTYQRSTGYLTKDSINNTDFYTIKDFVHIRYNHEKYPVDLQAGYHQKDFGANSFYTSKYPWQFEKTKGYFANLSSHFGKKIHWQPKLFYKLHYDEFQLFRESVYNYREGYFVHQQDTAQYAPQVYYSGHNYHKTQQYGGQVLFDFKSKWGKSYVNVALTNEKIWSNKLGKNLTNPVVINDRISYNKSDERTYFELQLNQLKKWQDFEVGVGINLLYEKKFGRQVTGGGFASYRQKHFTHYISLNTASRLPTFTDLYYQGPSNVGNPNLKPETTVTTEVGSKYFDRQNFITLSLFYRNAHNTIDWIKYLSADKWQPQNLTNLKTYGVELSGKHLFKDCFFKKISFSYAYLNMNKNESQTFISKYVLDYLKHKLNVGLSHKFFYNSDLTWSLIYKNRNGQYLDYINGQYQLFDYKPYLLTNVKLNKQYKKMRFGISIENLFDVAYNDLSYIKMPGRWFIFELAYIVK